MIQLTPQEYFVVSKQLGDPNDSTTYYIQAVIRNARTDATIDTLNLDDKTGQRFTKEWQVPADTSGSGFFVTITTTVYTDAAYTTKATNYTIDHETYVIHERTNPAMMGGGGASVDYKKIRDMIREELGKLPVPEKSESVNLLPLYSAMKGLDSRVGAIKIPQPEKVDLSEVLTLIRRVGNLIDNLDIPKTDLSPVLNELRGIDLGGQSVELSGQITERLNTTVDDIISKIKKFFSGDIDMLVDEMNVIKKKLESMPYVVLEPKEKKKYEIS